MLDSMNGIIGSMPQSVYRTTDGGNVWRALQLPDSMRSFTINDIALPTLNTVIVMMAEGDTWVTVRSDDAGATWAIYPGAPNMLRLHFIDSLEGWAVGVDRDTNSYKGKDVVYHTTTGGRVWDLQLHKKIEPSYGLFDVDFVDRLNGIAVGGVAKILRTTDGGTTWVPQQNTLNRNAIPSIPAVAFPSLDRALAVSVFGIVLRWANPAADLEALLSRRLIGLGANYPNPVTTYTMIPYEIPSAGVMSLKVYDVKGSEVAMLSSGPSVAGFYTVELDGSTLPAGTYTYVLKHNGATLSKQMVITK
jgi:hypothetical protein